MKRLAIGLAIVSLMAVGALAYADNYGGGHMMRGGMHDGMQGGMPGHMMKGCCGGAPMKGLGDETSRKFLDDTYALRKELHDKKFEYREVLRNPETTLEKIAKLERHMQGLKEQIREKAPEGMGRRFGSHRCMD